MSAIRILLKHDGVIYRFLNLDARPDGSLVVLIDRNSSAIGQNTENIDPEKILPHAKYTIHTTGTINYYLHKKTRTKTFNLREPLTDLSIFYPIGLYSIPTVLRLNAIRELSNTDYTINILTSDRMTFTFEVGPNNEAPIQNAVQINYGTYSLILRPAPHPEGVAKQPDHFFTAIAEPKNPIRTPALLTRAEAELRFQQKCHEDQTPIYMNGDGSYTLLAHVVMRVPPRLNIVFDLPDLSVEQIPFDYGLESHKVRFWIRGPGGRIKRKDLRRHIVSHTLDARFELDG